MLTDNAVAILEKRYLDGLSVDQLWDNVSGGNQRFRRLLSELKFMPNSPTLFNAGRNNGCTLSACFTFVIQDNMHDLGGIMDVHDKASKVAKAGGGVGFYGGLIREEGALIRSTGRKACGPVPVLRHLNSMGHMITQGGKRALAEMFVLPRVHPDIRKFIHCKDADPQSLMNFNISVGWDQNGFEEDPDLLHEQAVSAWGTGCPGVWFPDRVNQDNDNKHLGLWLTPNPCGEVPGRHCEPCNLGSLYLGRYVTLNREVDWLELEADAWTATEFLDDILDRNTFPDPEITAASQLTRKTGLGVMGWADMLAQLGLRYSSPEARELAEQVASFIQRISVACSEHMAKTKGPYPGYSDLTQHAPRRNETTTSIAPTGTIAIIIGARGWSIEPWFATDNTRETGDGMILDESVPKWLRDRIDGHRPELAHEIHWRNHVLMQAAWQRHVHLGVSKTINMGNDATVEDVEGAYRLMRDEGCKGGTIFRDGCRPDQVLRTKTKMPGFESTPVRRKLPQERSGDTVSLEIGGVGVYLTHNRYEDGSLAEIFCRGTYGSTVGGLLDAFCITFSLALQSGVSLETLVRHHRDTRYEPHGLVPGLGAAPSITAAIARWLERRYIGAAPEAPRNTGALCPECGAAAVYVGNCLTCTGVTCGWTKCG